MIYRLLTLLVILGVLIGVLLIGREQGAATTKATADQPAEAPGYSARNAEVIETGDDGRPLYTLNAVLVRQRPNDSRIQLDAPRMSFVASDGNTWRVQSKSGQIREDGSQVELYGDVALRGVLAGAATPVVVNTSIISFDTLAEEARTSAPVTLDWDGRKLGATGMVANLKDGKVRLESRVHGSFPPK